MKILSEDIIGKFKDEAKSAASRLMTTREIIDDDRLSLTDKMDLLARKAGHAITDNPGLSAGAGILALGIYLASKNKKIRDKLKKIKE